MITYLLLQNQCRFFRNPARIMKDDYFMVESVPRLGKMEVLHAFDILHYLLMISLTCFRVLL